MPCRRDYQAELSVISGKSKFQPVRQHPLNVELKKETGVKAVAAVAVKKTVIVSKGKTPLDDPLSMMGTVVHFPPIRQRWT